VSVFTRENHVKKTYMFSFDFHFQFLFNARLLDIWRADQISAVKRNLKLYFSTLRSY
jgi:hypothetical protein